MIWPLSPASYGLAGVALATGMVITTGGQKPACSSRELSCPSWRCVA
jgi:hypothetical protein